MRIVMHCVYFPPEVGGLESHVYYLCRALVRAGHQVDMVTSRSLPGVPEHEVMDGIEVWRTWFPSRSPAGWILHSLGSMGRTMRVTAAADVIHAQAFASILPCARAARRRGIPLVTTYHTSHFLKRAKMRRWRPVLGRLARLSAYSLAASEEIARVAEGLAPGIRVEALTNGVETDVFKRVAPELPPADRPRIVVPRRLFEKNGVEFFIRALPLITEAVDVEAVLIGDGPERRRLEALVVELDVNDRVRFMGAQPHREMPALLSSADLAVFPSLMEATSVAALECMACELPVAASRVGGLPEIVDDQVGGLFEPADPADLARAVVALLRRPDREILGRRARARVVERWSNERLARRHLEIYEQLIENPTSDGPGPSA